MAVLAFITHTLPSAWESEDPRMLQTMMQLVVDQVEARDGGQG